METILELKDIVLYLVKLRDMIYSLVEQLESELNVTQY